MAQRRLSVLLDIDTDRGTTRLIQAGKVMRTFGLDTKRAGDNVRSMGSSFNSLHDGMQRPIQRLRDYVLVLGNIRFALMNVRDLAIGWVAGLVKQSAELERLTVLMKGFSKAQTDAGRTVDAERNLRQIMTLANRTGFELKTMTDAFVKFQSADLNPQVYSLRGLAQAVAKFGGDTDTMHRAAIAIQQMAGKGVISMEELRQQLGEAVPSALKTLAASLGLTVQQLVKEISKGHVAAKPALQLMLKDMEITSAGAGERIANTMFGQIAQVRTGLMQLSADFTQLGSKEGFFNHIVENLKELNETLRSPEARQAVAQLGSTVDHVASSFANALKFVIEWRGVFGGLAVTLGKVWLLFKAFDIGAWFARMGMQAVLAVNNIISGTRQMGGVTGDMARWGDTLKTSIDSQRAAAQAWIQRTQQRVQVAQQSIVTTQNEIQTLKDLGVTYRQNIQILTQQRAQQIASLRAAQTLDAANIAMGRDNTASSAAVKAAQDEVNVSTRSLIAQKRLLIQTDAQLVAAEEQLQLAFTEEAAAAARATVAEEANATATGIMATMARGAGVAISALGEFFNIALGPIGLFIIACQQLSSWLNKNAMDADQAAESMRRYVGMMANVEELKKHQDRIKQLETALGENENASTWDKIMKRNLNPLATASIRADLEKERNYVASQSGNAYANAGRTQAEQMQYDRQNYMDRLRLKNGFQQQWQDITNRILAGDKTASADLQRLREQDGAHEAQYLNGQIQLTQRNIAKAKQLGKTDVVSQLTARLGGLRQQMQTVGLAGASSAGLVTDALNGKGNSTSKAAAAAAKRMGTLQGAVAGLQAQVAGDKSTHLQTFMAALAGGAYAGKSAGEIALLRQKAALQDAVQDGKAAQAQQEQYASAIGRVMGKIAELNVEMTGAHGNVAKFNAELDAGMHKNWSTDQIEKYRAALAQLDDTEHKVDIGKAFKDADKQMSKAAVDANALWTSLAKGTFLADQKAAELQGRFAHLLDGLKGDDLTAMQAKIDKIISDVQRADAAKVVFDWSQESQKIMNGLLEENEARQANYELEVARQRSLINWDALGIEERKTAEINFANWKKAFQQQVDRENESAILKQARDWYKLGINIQGALAGAMSSFTDSLSEGNFAFGKFAADIIKNLFKIILQATIAYGILSALGMTNGVSFGSYMKSGLSQGFSLQAPTHHTGGTIGQSNSFKNVPAAMFANAFKYHGGGVISKLGPKEVPMIGLEGERVLTEDQQKNLATPPKVTVNVINNGGQDLDAEVDTQFNGREMIVSVVLDAMQKQGALRNAVGAIAKS